MEMWSCNVCPFFFLRQGIDFILNFLRIIVNAMQINLFLGRKVLLSLYYKNMPRKVLVFFLTESDLLSDHLGQELIHRKSLLVVLLKRASFLLQYSSLIPVRKYVNIRFIHNPVKHPFDAQSKPQSIWASCGCFCAPNQKQGGH